MNQPQNIISAQSANSSKHALEARLKALQDKGRLAIHVWERTIHNGFSQKTCDDFMQVPREDLRSLYQAHIPIQSVSLLLAASTNKSMKPWMVKPYADPTAHQLAGSYLLNLDQAQESPPLIIRADRKVLGSGSHVYDKDVSYGLCQPSELRELYRDAITQWQQRHYPEKDPITFHEEDEAVIKENTGRIKNINRILRELALADNDNLRANKALDLLAKEHCESTGHIIAPNEVAISATMEHVAAIAIPLYMEQSDSPEKHANYTARMKLWGALSGLEHIAQGYDLPVVFYHVSEPHKGEITSIGQGKNELEQVAAEALAFLQAKRYFYGEITDSDLTSLHAMRPQLLKHYIGIGREFP